MADSPRIKTAKLPAKPGGVTVIFTNAAGELAGEGARLWELTGLDFARLSAAARFAGKPGQSIDIPAPAGVDADRLVVIGTGKPGPDNPLPPTARRDFGGSLMTRLLQTRADKFVIVADDAVFTPSEVGAIVAGMRLKAFRFDRYKTTRPSDDDAAPRPGAVTITVAVADKRAADRQIAAATAVADGILFARELVHEPSNVLGPVEFAARVKELEALGVDVEILTDTAMKKLGMGALLAVAQGSPRPARLAVMQWTGGRKADSPLALVGKGVVFDAGGISIKPAASMEDMKGDMGGGAAVAGTMKALAMRKARANVVGVIGIVENMPDGQAFRPGDILTSMSGQTIEVVNTDAEGRLVLADALWYTKKRFSPRYMIDLATLTGAISISLGQEYAGLFSNSDELSDHLLRAGNQTSEKLWRLPLGPYYDKLIDSRFADMKNAGGRLGNASTAAQFLARFVDDCPWAHLDIAGMAFGNPPSDINTSWATGFGVALLDRLVADLYES